MKRHKKEAAAGGIFPSAAAPFSRRRAAEMFCLFVHSGNMAGDRRDRTEDLAEQAERGKEARAHRGAELSRTAHAMDGSLSHFLILQK